MANKRLLCYILAKMKFVKMQGAGNDFVVIEPDSKPHDWAKLAVTICDRHYGIGADGILLLMPSKVADFRMRILNADGSEAETCGNGLRCLVRYFVERKVRDFPDREISVETLAGIRKARVLRNVGRPVRVRIGMGEPNFGARDIPVLLERSDARVNTRKPLINCLLEIGRRELPLALVSMGNPHAVFFTDKPVADFPLVRLGPKVEHNKIFPEGANFEVAHMVNRRHIEARVWERGAGETLACGSGACAIAVAARLSGYVDDKVAVQLPGGVLEIEWPGSGEVFLSGPAEFVFTGELPS